MNDNEYFGFEVTELDRERLLAMEVDGRVDGECGRWTAFRYPDPAPGHAGSPFLLLVHEVSGLRPVYDHILSLDTLFMVLDRLVEFTHEYPSAEELD